MNFCRGRKWGYFNWRNTEIPKTCLLEGQSVGRPSLHRACGSAPNHGASSLLPINILLPQNINHLTHPYSSSCPIRKTFWHLKVKLERFSISHRFSVLGFVSFDSVSCWRCMDLLYVLNLFSRKWSDWLTCDFAFSGNYFSSLLHMNNFYGGSKCLNSDLIIWLVKFC